MTTTLTNAGESTANTASAPGSAASPPSDKSPSADLDSILDLSRRATVAYERPDLTEIIDRAVERHAGRDLSVLVVGEFKQGKSTLVNALLNAPVCAVADDVATVVPTIVRHGTAVSARVVYRAAAGSDEQQHEDVGLNEALRLGSEAGNPGNRSAVHAIELSVPRRLLESGLQLIDTPGVGGLDSTHGAATMTALSLAEVVLFVSDASQPLTASEVEFLTTGSQRCPNVVLVVSKTDIHPAWRRVVEINQQYLTEAGLDIEIVPVSSVLRQQATAQNSREMNEESGYARLVPLLRDAAEGDAARLAHRSTLSDVVMVLDQLASAFESERGALEDPESIAAIVGDLERAKERAGRLRSQSAKWFQTLNDGAQDLTADLDHDLRGRVRSMLDEVDDALGDNDPVKIWDGFEQWLHTRAAYEISAHHHELATSSDALSQRVAEHFADDETQLGVALQLPSPIVGARRIAGEIDLTKTKKFDNALAAMRGSYGGLLMFGMMGQMLGLALLNPLTVVVGVGLGRRALKEEKARRLAQRQQQAKNAVRKYLDEVNVEASKVSRDTVRQVHRDLRDQFSNRAEALQTTIQESIHNAEHATRRAAAERAARLADVNAELARVQGLRRRAEQSLATTVTAS